MDCLMNVSLCKCFVMWLFHLINVFLYDWFAIWMFHRTNVSLFECLISWMFCHMNDLFNECIVVWMFCIVRMFYWINHIHRKDIRKNKVVSKLVYANEFRIKVLSYECFVILMFNCKNVSLYDCFVEWMFFLYECFCMNLSSYKCFVIWMFRLVNA